MAYMCTRVNGFLDGDFQTIVQTIVQTSVQAIVQTSVQAIVQTIYW